MVERPCEAVAALEAELALGVAGTDERAGAMAHLERCPACRHRLRDLADVADALAGLAPAAEPPAGFESRVLAALPRRLPAHRRGALGRRSERREIGAPPGRLPARRRGGNRLAWAAAAAAVALLVVGAAVAGWAVGTATPHRPAPAAPAAGGAAATTADLVAGGRTVGTVVVAGSGGTEPWISMAVESPVGATVVRCDVRRAGGGTTVVGTFRMVDGYGYWAAPLPAGPPVRSARLVGPGGRVLATADLARPAG